jgi:hypothetical protein
MTLLILPEKMTPPDGVVLSGIMQFSMSGASPSPTLQP